MQGTLRSPDLGAEATDFLVNQGKMEKMEKMGEFPPDLGVETRLRTQMYKCPGTPGPVGCLFFSTIKHTDPWPPFSAVDLITVDLTRPQLCVSS